MSVAGGSVRANLLLCDAAQVVGDKLYILGGGWSYLWIPAPGTPVSFAAAIDFILPWDFANRQLNIVARVVTEDGEDVIPDGGEGPVRAEGRLVAGRAPTARAGADLHVPLVIPFPPIVLVQGGYVFEVLVDNESITRTGFQLSVLGPQPG